MSLLDGDLQAVFGSAFGPLLLDGTLINPSLTEDGYGGFNDGADSTAAVKLMFEEYSDFTRAKYDIPAKDVKLIVLQEGVTIGGDPAVPAKGWEVTARGTTYRIEDIDQDPAQAAWVFQGRPK